MFDMLFGALAGLAHIASLAIVLRRVKASPAGVAVFLSLVGYVVMLALVVMLGVQASFWALSIAYWFVSICFLMVFGAVYKSISLRMVLDLYQRPGRSAPRDAIRVAYVEADSFENRLGVMVRAGLAEKVADGYVLAPKGRRVAGVAAALQRAFAIERSG